MWLISLGAVVLCSYFLAKMTANLISLQFDSDVPFTARAVVKAIPTALPPVPDTTSFNPILERNVFDSTAVQTTFSSAEEAGSDEPVDMSGPAVPTTLGIKLISTFSVGEGIDDRSSCIISSGKGEGDIYTVGDEKEFAPDTRVVRILYNRVEFSHKGRLEFVELEDFTKGVAMNVPPARDAVEETGGAKDRKEAGAVEKKGEGSFVIDRAEIDDAIANLDKLYTQIRAVPHFSGGKPDGLKLLSVKPASVFSKLGLVRGDILKRINGMELDIKRGLEIFNQLKNEQRITVDLERRGSVQTFEYEIR